MKDIDMKTEAPELYINGMETLPDVINMIKDTMDEGKTESAKDYLNQLQEYLAKRDINILELQETGEKILQGLEKNTEILDPQQTVVDNFHEWNMKQMDRYEPVMVLMTILGQTLKIMKSAMPKHQYDSIMDNVYESKDRIEPFTKPQIH
jgi:hypothetical protein